MRIIPKFVALTLLFTSHVAFSQVDIKFDSKEHTFSADEKTLISDIINKADKNVRKLLPALTAEIVVNVVTTNRNLDVVGGGTGRADAPGVIEVMLSTATKGGILGAAKQSLKSVVYHEFHHLVRGWTMVQNKFGVQPGIPISSVNEGLASVFADTYTDEYFAEANDYPQNANEWFAEILLLPRQANYGHWVAGDHPDGRSAIGYRVGRYIIHQAIQASGKNVVELTKVAPEVIIKMVTDRLATQTR
jgi:uncharacterized protein YjaZ